MYYRTVFLVGAYGLGSCYLCDSFFPAVAAVWAVVCMSICSLGWVSTTTAVFFSTVGVMAAQSLRILDYPPNSSIMDGLGAVVILSTFSLCLGAVGTSSLRAWHRGAKMSCMIRALSLAIGFVAFAVLEGFFLAGRNIYFK